MKWKLARSDWVAEARCAVTSNSIFFPAFCRAFNYMVEEIPRQGRLEGCHRMSAATHLICGLESV